MARIEVGMLVRVINATATPRHIGHVGKVLSKCDVYDGNFDIEGAENDDDGHLTSFPEHYLEPINPPKEDRFEKCDEDFTEDLKLWLNAGVEA